MPLVESAEVAVTVLISHAVFALRGIRFHKLQPDSKLSEEEGMQM